MSKPGKLYCGHFENVEGIISMCTRGEPCQVIVTKNRLWSLKIVTNGPKYKTLETINFNNLAYFDFTKQKWYIGRNIFNAHLCRVPMIETPSTHIEHDTYQTNICKFHCKWHSVNSHIIFILGIEPDGAKPIVYDDTKTLRSPNFCSQFC